MSGFVTPAALPNVPPQLDLMAMRLAEQLRESIFQASVTSPRSLQVTIGASELGTECDRKIAFRHKGIPAVNHPDPLRALVGLGVHLELAELFRRIDAGSGRFLVEVPVTYRGIPGTCDLFDRRTGTVIDWKTSTKSRVGKYRAQGPPPGYRVQVQTYGAALAELGEKVNHVALAWIAVDGDLSDLFVWTEPYQKALADNAIDRVEALREADPATVPATPTRLCPWCAHYQPGSSDLSRACPGPESR